MFPKYYYRHAQRLAADVHMLWLYDKLTVRRVRALLKRVLGPVELQSGSFRTSALLPRGIIKVPHDVQAIQSTFLEMELFTAVARHTTLHHHFPHTELIATGGVPVLMQERVTYVGHRTSEDVAEAVTGFARQVGLGDIHPHNYGWEFSRHGPYPVFVDCETSQSHATLTPHDIHRVAGAVARWPYTVSSTEFIP
jgi:hypothetical protein